MAPYCFDQLKNARAELPSDFFELVGILIHSGNAESGHYYSYVRELTSDSARRPSWIEFNDADVNTFDIETISDTCYGGLSDQSSQFDQYFKPYNAYMLFYRRRTVTASTSSDLRTKGQMTTTLTQRYALMNEFAIRKLCQFDEAYLDFIIILVKRLTLSHEAGGERDLETTKNITIFCLNYLDCIGSRIKVSQFFLKIATLLHEIIRIYPHCRQNALSWICDQEHDPLKKMLLRCPHAEVRKSFAMLIVNITRLREMDANVDVNAEVSSDPLIIEKSGELFLRMKGLVDVLHVYWKAWDEYFSLLVRLAGLGLQESQTLLQLGFLQTCLELMVLDHPRAHIVREKAITYQRIATFIEKKRKYSFAGIIELFCRLLMSVDLNERRLGDVPQDRLFQNAGKTALTVHEYALLESDFGLPSIVPGCVFLEKAISSHASRGTVRDLVRMLLLADEHLQLVRPIKITLMEGLSTDPASLAIPFLDAALAFCEISPDRHSIQDVLRKAASDVESIGSCAGAENLHFFKAARRLHNIVVKWSGESFEGKVRSLAYLWGPPLLTFEDTTVRSDTVDFINAILFSCNFEEIDNEHKLVRIQKAGRELCMKCLERLSQIACNAALPDQVPLEQIKQVVVLCLEKFFDVEDEDDDRMMEHAKSRSFQGLSIYQNIFSEVSIGTFASIEGLVVEESDEGNSG